MKNKILILILVLFLAGCVPPPETLQQLSSVEVREYEGKKLDSVSSFRDNSIKGVQFVNITEYELEITGLVENNISLTYEEVLENQKYSKVVTLYCVEGWSRKILWEGVLIKDLVEKAGAKEEANTVIFHAYDGYTSSLPLDYIINNQIILAYRQNNVTLPPENGFPFQVVAEDKYGIKWVKWVTKIELSDDEDYRGFWEARGYDNKADVGGPVLG
jgi:DMSO/TMAO reductase YedYZ molybdopterin-dependent catalytic subunit